MRGIQENLQVTRYTLERCARRGVLKEAIDFIIKINLGVKTF